jgi:hypothetical protein
MHESNSLKKQKTNDMQPLPAFPITHKEQRTYNSIYSILQQAIRYTDRSQAPCRIFPGPITSTYIDL